MALKVGNAVGALRAEIHPAPSSLFQKTLSWVHIKKTKTTFCRTMRTWIAASAVLVLALISGVLIKEPANIVRENKDTYTLRLETIHNPEKAVNAFAKALSFPTVGKDDSPNHVGDPQPFLDFHKHLTKAYPTVFKSLKVETINEYSLLMKWTGNDVSLKPMLFVSHIDVVPASQPGNWTYPPFSGTVADGFIWGRGALDNKISLVGVLEAIQQLLAVKFTPQRTIFLAFGHDEEMGGDYGAEKIADTLKTQHGVTELEIVLDEGGMIDIDGLGVKNLISDQVAGVGMATKGFESWKIHLKGEGGHSSMPPVGQGTSVAARMAAVLARFEAQQTSSKLESPTTEFLQALAPGIRFAPLRMAFELADNRIINPILGQIIGGLGHPLLNAFVRTTAAVIAIDAGVGADNVLPTEGSIEVNFRVLPGEDTSAVKQYIDQIIKKEREIGLAKAEKIISRHPPSAITPASGPNYDLIVRAIMETFTPDPKVTKQKLIVAPILIVGGTDALKYEDISAGRTFRFNPVKIESTKGDLSRVHGVDERVSIDGYLDAVRFYMRFIKLAAGDE